jgi:hypothetical protein
LNFKAANILGLSGKPGLHLAQSEVTRADMARMFIEPSPEATHLARVKHSRISVPGVGNHWMDDLNLNLAAVARTNDRRHGVRSFEDEPDLDLHAALQPPMLDPVRYNKLWLKDGDPRPKGLMHLNHDK